ncbi:MULTISPECIES: sulfatase-like hydrolase/transferase [Niastella]|uniref:Sulfatase-like hydrolase/transferase n=1 Tax=Niastella soli TaxID=2821487 RepID=A0ABS3YYD4_9BACT|nr:sulfatase-like hydrolase/transferase [Niastella soli]MBO9202934.1 sulfatase-like hydrolase/transferase [Niastella soli]
MRYQKIISCCIAWVIVFAFANCQSAKKNSQPNIIIIYIDDLGYGDVSCYGATRVQTPNVDRLAQNGLRFTDAHCGAATCTPSRFSLLTGMYAFRNNAAVLPGDAPLLIPQGIETLPSILQKRGYATAVVGKWHLGLGIGTIDWNKPINPGPLETGFDHSFIIPATVDRVPCVYVDGHNVYQADPADPILVSYKEQIGDEPTGLSNREMLKMKADTQHSNTIINGISRIGFMTGGKKARWRDEDMADVFTTKAKAFINSNKNKPFFLYLALTDIHVPRTPHERFLGKNPMGRRGDVIVEMDWVTGEITKDIERLGLDKNTLILFTSDNGPVLDDGYSDEAVEKAGTHQPAGNFRGGKYSAFEGGTRVPTIAYWPGTIKPGVSSALMSQVDWMASLAALTGDSLTGKAGPDSRNVLPVLLGTSDKAPAYMLEEAYTLSIRYGNWKYIAPQEKGTPDWLKNKRIESGLIQLPQLYDLQTDPGETKNVAAQHPELVQQLQNELKKIQTTNLTGR